MNTVNTTVFGGSIARGLEDLFSVSININIYEYVRVPNLTKIRKNVTKVQQFVPQ